LKRLHAYGLFFLLVMATGCHFNSRRMPSLKESYRKTDQLPFGSFIAYKGFQQLFAGQQIQETTAPFDETWPFIKDNSSGGNYSLYFLISRDLVLRKQEASALLNYVGAGNDLFISATYIDPKILDALSCSVDYKSELAAEVNYKMQDTRLSMYFGKTFDAANYGYYYYPFLNYLSKYDSSSARILGVNEKDQPNFGIFFYGRGRVYLHLAPRAFSNYFLLTANNFHYFENVLVYLRLSPKKIYWDEYYKNILPNGNPEIPRDVKKEFSSLGVIWQYPALKWAFWLATSGMLLYLVFHIKRKHRPIAVMPEKVNSTVAFTETIGRLNFQQKNNRRLADKMITYFFEHLRNKYFINTGEINDHFINYLSGKSGVPKKQAYELFHLIRHIRSQDDIDDEQLMELNEKIENFNVNTI
jgi:hypothetical protein